MLGGLKADDGSSLSDSVIDALLDSLLSSAGRDLLKAFLNDADAKPTLRFNPQLVKNFSERADSGLREQLEPLFKTLLEVSGLSKADTTKGLGGSSTRSTLKEARELLVAMGVDRGVPPQLLEILDDVGLWPAEFLGAPLTDGLLAAVVGFVISALVNGDRYRRGHIRWDDAIDSMVFDAVKAGVTGLVVSAIAGGLASAATPAVGLVIGALVAPLVYMVVSKVVDHVYMTFLGGDVILQARGLHRDYLEMAFFTQRELWTRLRRNYRIGVLVDRLDAICDQTTTGETRDQLRREARDAFKAFAIVVQPRPLAMQLADDYEGALWKYLSETLKVSGSKQLVSYNEIKYFERTVHEEYWSVYSAHSGFKKVKYDSVREGLASDLDALPPSKKGFLEKIVEHLYSLEEKRGMPDAPLRFWADWRDEVSKAKEGFYIHASSLTELIYIVHVLQGVHSWPWGSSLSSRLWPELSIYKSETVAIDTSATSDPDDPRDRYREFNKFYVKDLYGGIWSGKYRLFSYGNNKVGGQWPRYIAAPAIDMSPGEQCQRLRDSLHKYHPQFSRAPQFLSTMAPVDIERASAASDDHQFMLACLGLRVYVVDIYTATFRGVNPGDMSEVVNTQEAYFASFEQAERAFSNLKSPSSLVAVRPGPQVIGDALLEAAKSWKVGEASFALQNELLGRLAEGLILLDQLAGKNELNLARLAGAGVLLSWWWSFTGRTRKELVDCLKNEIQRQALRAEIMGALLEVQRLHILSHPYFQETFYHPRALEDDESLRQQRERLPLT